MSEIRWRLSGPDVETLSSFGFMFESLYRAGDEDLVEINEKEHQQSSHSRDNRLSEGSDRGRKLFRWSSCNEI